MYKNLKIKIICGFQDEQKHTIDMEEAHKAYYLFMHPNERGIFNSGLALIGSSIREIIPDYHSTMGWNSTHKIDSDDMNEIREKEIDTKIRDAMFKAKETAQYGRKEDINLPLSEVKLLN